MSLFVMACTAALHAAAGTPCAAAEPATLAAVSLSDAELAGVHGRGLPLAGIDQAGPAAREAAVTIAQLGVRTSDTIREIVDNWTLDVAVPLIAAAAGR